MPKGFCYGPYLEDEAVTVLQFPRPLPVKLPQPVAVMLCDKDGGGLGLEVDVADPVKGALDSLDW